MTSTSRSTSSNRTEWWTELGLERAGHASGATTTYRATDQIQQVLAKHPPVAFAGDTNHEILTAVNEAFVAGWQQAMWIGVAVVSILVVFVLFRGPTNASASTTPVSET